MEHAEAVAVCVVCADKRRWMPSDGQKWAALGKLARAGRRLHITGLKPDLFGITVMLSVAVLAAKRLRRGASAGVQAPIGPGSRAGRIWGSQRPRDGGGGIPRSRDAPPPGLTAVYERLKYAVST